MRSSMPPPTPTSTAANATRNGPTAVNAAGSRHVAEAAQAAGAYLVAIGTDFVFPGDGGAPYAEDATASPLSVYGASKLAGEQAILEADPGFAVARTAWVYGGAGKHFPRTVLTVLRDRGGWRSSTTRRAAPPSLETLRRRLSRSWPSVDRASSTSRTRGATTRFALARAVAEAAGLDSEAVAPTTTAAFLAKYPLPAARPADSTLVNTRAAALGISLRPWREAVVDYVPRLAAELGLTGRSLHPVGGLARCAFSSPAVPDSSAAPTFVTSSHATRRTWS